MIDSLVNMLFFCAHRKMTRPMTPRADCTARAGGPYVVCLDCGKEFDYDMTTGKVIRSKTQVSWAPARARGLSEPA